MIDRLSHLDALCSLSRGARLRGNGWLFGYPPFAHYWPSTLGISASAERWFSS